MKQTSVYQRVNMLGKGTFLRIPDKYDATARRLAAIDLIGFAFHSRLGK